MRCAFGLSRFTEAGPYNIKSAVYKIGGTSLFAKEVGFEPKTALDGGKDGLMFYRAICDRWLPCCKKGGEILLECGDSQGEDIRTIFDGKASSSEIMYDFNHIDRVVKIIV